MSTLTSSRHNAAAAVAVINPFLAARWPAASDAMRYTASPTASSATLNATLIWEMQVMLLLLQHFLHVSSYSVLRSSRSYCRSVESVPRKGNSSATVAMCMMKTRRAGQVRAQQSIIDSDRRRACVNARLRFPLEKDPRHIYNEMHINGQRSLARVAPMSSMTSMTSMRRLRHCALSGKGPGLGVRVRVSHNAEHSG